MIRGNFWFSNWVRPQAWRNSEGWGFEIGPFGFALFRVRRVEAATLQPQHGPSAKPQQ